MLGERERVALHELIDVVTRYYPLGFALRLEAFYQHYARYQVMDGHEPLPRDFWWVRIVSEDPKFAAVLVCESGFALPDAEGARL